MYFGAHLDTALNGGRPNDTPVAFNERIGQKGSIFEFAEDFPLDFNNPPPITLLSNTKSDAFLYLSIYIPKGYNGITNGDVDDLVNQLAGIAKTGRRIFLRIGPEMNGSWQPYGQQPTAFLALWKKIHQSVQSNSLTKGSVAFLWAPSSGFGYPYPGQPYSITSTSSPDFNLLDTNKDGKFDASDDPYSPYYPGDEYVDWTGLSTYYFGRTYPWIANELPPVTTRLDH
jgi:beta-mannanase